MRPEQRRYSPCRGERRRHVLLAEPVRLDKPRGPDPRLRVSDYAAGRVRPGVPIRAALLVWEKRRCDPRSPCALRRRTRTCRPVGLENTIRGGGLHSSAAAPRWRVSAASDPVKHVLACASVSGKFARNQESTQGLVLLTHSFACSFQRFTTAGGSSARSGRCACGTVPGKAGFHGFGPVVRRVSAVARRPAARGRSGCPGRGPHRRAAGRPGRGRAAVSRPSGRRR